MPGRPLYQTRKDRRSGGAPSVVPVDVDPIEPHDTIHVDTTTPPTLPNFVLVRAISEFIPFDEMMKNQTYLVSKRLRNKILKMAIIHQDVSSSQRKQLWLSTFGRTDLILAQEKIALRLPDSAGRDTVYAYYLSFPRTPEAVAEIERDVVRTLPSNDLFASNSPVGAENRTKLRNVLLAVSSAEPAVGYCQGMNFVAATLLIALGMSESDAFFMFISIMRHYHFRHLYSPAVPLLPLRMFHFSRLVRQHVPQVWHHLNAKTFSVEIFANQWIMTLFSYYLEPEVLGDKLWTLFFLLGWKFLFTLGVSILSLLQDAIVGMDVEEISAFMGSSKAPLPSGAESPHPYADKARVKQQLLFAAENFHITNSQLETFSQQFLSEKLVAVISEVDLNAPADKLVSLRKPVLAELMVEESRTLGFSWLRAADSTVEFLRVDLSALSTPNRPMEKLAFKCKDVDVPVRSLQQLRQAVLLVADKFSRDIVKVESQLKDTEKRLNVESKQFNALVASASKLDVAFEEVSARKAKLTLALRDAVVGNSPLDGSPVRVNIPSEIGASMAILSGTEREYDEKREQRNAVREVLAEQEQKIGVIVDLKNSLILEMSTQVARLEEIQNEIIYRSIQSAIDCFSNV